MLEGMRQGAGFTFDWKHVYGFPPGQVSQYPSVLVMEGTEEQSDLVYPKLECLLSYEIEAIHQVPTDEAHEPDEVARQMIEDIERCVLADPTRGGNAIDTRPVRTEPPVIFAGQVNVVSLFQVKYHRNRKLPGANV